MNIGIVTTWFERGAAYVSKQYMELLQEENNTFIYARGGEKYAKNNPEWDLPNVHWGKKDYFNSNPTPIKKSCFINWIKENEIDALIFNEQQWWPPIIWARELGIKVGSYIDYYTKTSVPYFAIFDFLLCNTKRHHSVFEWHPQAVYIPWGTDITLFSPRAKREQDKDKIVFFNSSGYNPDRKGVYPLVKAYSEISTPSTKLILHTQVDLKRYYNDLAQVVEKLEKTGQLEIISKTVPAPGLYHLGDIYCYISKLDGIGLTLPEAISCGLQAIVPDNAPMNEFIDPGKNGKVVKIERFYDRDDDYYWQQCDVNIDDLIEKLKYYIDNKDEISVMKQHARDFAVSNLNWDDRKQMLNSFVKSATVQEVDANLVNSLLSMKSPSNTLKDMLNKYYLIFRNFTR